jgi:hypothetical protein
VVKALAGRPVIEGAGVGRLFVWRYAILAHRKCVVAVVAQNLSDGSGRGRHAAIPAGETGGRCDVLKIPIHARMRCCGQSAARRGLGRRWRRYGSSYSANHCWPDCRRWEFGSGRRMCRQRHSPHRRSVSTLRSARRQAPSQVPATILLTRQGFCQRLPDTVVPLEHAARVSHSPQRLASMSTPSVRFLVHRSPVGLGVIRDDSVRGC